MTACKFSSSTTPRIIPGRHADDCADRYGDDLNGCRGCLPCESPHCRVCNRTHAEGTCAECLAEVRDNLRGIARMCDALPEEVEHRGIEGEAMVLLGPVSDPEAWGHVTASVASGRLAREWVEEGGGELHPLTVLLSWGMVYRDALDHSDAEDSTLATAVDYLDRNLSYLGGYEWTPFEDFARDLRRCAGHLEAVLHDSERGVRANVPCFECHADLERLLGKDGFEDQWTCRGCRRKYTIAEYNFALRAALEAPA